MTSTLVYDPSRPDFQVRAHEVYRSLRDDHPVYHNPAAGFWALSRFEDVRAAAGDPQSFSSENTDISQGLLPQIQSMDPPRHDQLRRLVQLAFTPRRVSSMEPRVREIARALIDAFKKDGHCDLLGQFARHLPSLVIGEMIGVPEDRREAFLEWTESMVEVPEGEAAGERNRLSALKIYEEFARLLEDRRRQRRDDLMSALVDAEEDGLRLTQEELLGFCFVLIVAGNDTTTNLISNGAVMLAHHPEQRHWLAQEPSLIPNAVEEMVRYEAPAQALPRRTLRDVRMHGITIPEGELVRLVWGAANRDGREFPDPDRFDVKRSIKRHLGFGHGLHFCLGANLARLEARVAFEELLAQMPEYKLEAEPRWLTSIWARAYAEVPVRFDLI